jgi:2-hydroxychromene-2-carboxylate isomerase
MNTPAPIGFWFDFISPFGYFASLRVDELAARHGRTVDWRPLLIGVTVLKVMGLKPLLDTPLKGDYTRRQIARYARRHGVALGRDPSAPPMNPLPAARSFAWLRAHAPSHAQPFAAAALHAYWVDARPLDEPEALRATASRAGVPGPTIEAALADPDAARRLRAEVEAAVAAGVFGSPFVIVDGEPFFGVDQFDLIDQWLAAGGW